jgi:hypothetical protein
MAPGEFRQPRQQPQRCERRQHRDDDAARRVVFERAHGRAEPDLMT